MACNSWTISNSKEITTIILYYYQEDLGDIIFDYDYIDAREDEVMLTLNYYTVTQHCFLKRSKSTKNLLKVFKGGAATIGVITWMIIH